MVLSGFPDPGRFAAWLLPTTPRYNIGNNSQFDRAFPMQHIKKIHLRTLDLDLAESVLQDGLPEN